MYGLIMAGGVGKRFWPMSRNKSPKQFLELFSHRSMIQMTYDRLQPLILPEHIFVVTNKQQVKLTEHHLPGIPQKNIIGEPIGKDTAPCIGLGALFALAQDPQAVLAVLPADHLITNVPEFQRIISSAASLAAEKDCLITIGIKPTRPETGYGYIQWDQKPAEEFLPEQFRHKGFLKVKAFAEKPNYTTAQQFIESGDFLWNSGIFIWKARTILQEIEEHLPELYDSLMDIKRHLFKRGFRRSLITAYREITSISIDYGVMEKSQNVFMLKGDFGWSDVGNWGEYYRLREHDQNGNVIIGQSELRDAKNNLIISDKNIIAAIGIDNMVVVNVENAILVCPCSRVQEIKEIVDHLTRKNIQEYL